MSRVFSNLGSVEPLTFKTVIPPESSMNICCQSLTWLRATIAVPSLAFSLAFSLSGCEQAAPEKENPAVEAIDATTGDPAAIEGTESPN
ncbi:MAG: hypothetical protein O3B13_13970 [Planctomycetota bacterium]|nr:hypothetical protein [Planctomycetota bacterium]